MDHGQGPTSSRSQTLGVRVLDEREHARGWRYRVAIAGRPEEHLVTLSFRDHDHWSGGSEAPSATLVRVLACVLSASRGVLPASFDCSTGRAMLRRCGRCLDEEVRRSSDAA